MVQFFETVGNFIAMIVDGIGSFFSIVGNGIGYIQMFLGYVPAPLAALILSALTIMIAIAILKLI